MYRDAGPAGVSSPENTYIQYYQHKKQDGISAFYVFSLKYLNDSSVEIPFSCRSVDRSRPGSKTHLPAYLKLFSKQLLVRKMQMRMSTCKLFKLHFETCHDSAQTSSRAGKYAGSSVQGLHRSPVREPSLWRNDIAMPTSEDEDSKDEALLTHQVCFYPQCPGQEFPHPNASSAIAQVPTSNLFSTFIVLNQPHLEAPRRKHLLMPHVLSASFAQNHMPQI